MLSVLCSFLVAFAAHATPVPQPTPIAPANPFSFSIAPAAPTVYFSNYPFSNGTYITAPWFKFVPSVVNTTGRIITVMSMRVDVVYYRHGVAYSSSMDVDKSPWGGVFQSLPGKPLAAEEYFVGTLDRADSSVYSITLRMDGCTAQRITLKIASSQSIRSKRSKFTTGALFSWRPGNTALPLRLRAFCHLKQQLSARSYLDRVNAKFQRC